MPYLKLSFGNTVFAALLVVSYIIGITGTEHTIYSLADEAYMRRSEFMIHPSHVEWYRDGMQLFAMYNLNRWGRTHLQWAIEKKASDVPEDDVEAAFTEAFAKWNAVALLSFEKVPPGQKADIGIWFESNLPKNQKSFAKPRGNKLSLDEDGINIVINDNLNWTNENKKNYYNLRFAALHETGRVLGLGDTNFPESIMDEGHEGFKKKGVPVLPRADIEKITKLHGMRLPGGLIAFE